MITRPILEAQRKLYEQGRQKAATDMTMFTGAIEAIDALLNICAQGEAAQAAAETPAANEGESHA